MPNQNRNKRSREEEGDSKSDSIKEFKEKLANKDNLSMNDMAKMLMAMHESNEDRHSELLDSTQDLSDRVNFTMKKVDEHEKRLINLEMRALAANMIMKNVPVHKKAEQDKKPETIKQTREQVMEAISALGIKEEITVVACRRFKGDQRHMAPIQVALANTLQKRLIFQAMAKAKPNFSVDHEYPLALKDQLKDLREKAHNMRKATNFTAKFRVEVRGGNPLIVQKSQGEDRYTPV